MATVGDSPAEADGESSRDRRTPVGLLRHGLRSVFRKLPRDRPVLGLLAGIGFFVLASALRWVLGGVSEGFGPMMFLPAILFAGLFGGIRIGLAMTAICFAVAWVMFFPPYGTLILTTPYRVTMAAFLLTAALELYVIRMLNLAIAELSEARERSNTLFRELQHRVANNLQIVAALLTLRRKSLKAGSAGAQALEAAESRLSMMSRVHRRLNDPRFVDQPVEAYLEALCADLIAASDTPDVRLTVTGEPVVLELEALMSLSLIVAELITNSLKHAFRGRTGGSLRIELRARNGVYSLTVADDGPGLPETFGKTNTGSLGQGILQSLAKQLHGQISFEDAPGAVAKLVFRP